MKSFITGALGLLISASSFAMSLTCVTEFPTTSVFGEVQGDEFVVQVYHHNGTGYMPLHVGVITPNDLPVMAERADVFHSLGQLYEFRYPLSACKRFDQDLMSCTKGKETEINGVKVRPWSLYTKRVTTEMDDYRFDEIEVSFMMDVEGKTQNFTSKYTSDECYQQKRAKKIFSVIGNR